MANELAQFIKGDIVRYNNEDAELIEVRKIFGVEKAKIS